MTTEQILQHIREVDKNHPMYTHGMSRSRPYSIWRSMINRCENKNTINYERYGAKGVTVCKKWHIFINFWDDMKETYDDTFQLDRINNAKGYSKDNCRWVSINDQQRNKSNVTLYSHNGLSLPSSEWDKILGLKKGTVRNRILRSKWDIEKALTLPNQSNKKPNRKHRAEGVNY